MAAITIGGIGLTATTISTADWIEVEQGGVSKKARPGRYSGTAEFVNITASSSITVSGLLTAASDLAVTSSLPQIHTGTSSGSDNKRLALRGAGSEGAAARGALIGLYGNNETDAPGEAVIRAGTATGAAIRFETGTTTAPRAAVLQSGNFQIGYAYTTDQGYKLAVNGTCGNTTGVWATISDDRLKKEIRPVNQGLQKSLDIAECVIHYKLKDNVGSGKEGLRTQYSAQKLIEHGFEGHISLAPPPRSCSEEFGWEYEKTKSKEGEDVEIVKKEGQFVYNVENNFAPYAFLAIKELYEEIEKLKGVTKK